MKIYEELKQIKYGTTEDVVECASVAVDPDGVLIPPEPIEHPTTDETVSNVAPTAQEDTKDVPDEE